MQFQVNKDEYYPTLASRLKSFVPTFQSLFDKDEGAYLCLADFYQYILLNINNSHIIRKCADFINEAIELGKDQTIDAIMIEIFQPLHLDNKIADIIRPHLSSQALMIFKDGK